MTSITTDIDDLYNAAEQLLTLITPATSLRNVQLDAYRRDVAEHGRDRLPILEALFYAAGFPSMFDAADDDADEFVSSLNGVAHNWDYLDLNWNEEDLDEDALYAHSLPS